MITFYFIRHGHTIWHDTGGVAGRTDIELSPSGVAAAQALGASWAQDAVPDYWYSSPMLRTRETLNLLRSEMGLATRKADFVEDSRLVELDFGDWEGMTWGDVHRLHDSEMQAWGKDWVNSAPPNGEKFAAQQIRCVAWLDDTLAKLEDNHRNQQVVVVTHGGSIRALVCHCLGWPLSRAMSFSVDPARVTELELDRVGGKWLVRCINAGRFNAGKNMQTNRI